MLSEIIITSAEEGLTLGEVLKRRGFSRRLTVKLKHTEGGITRQGVLLRTVDRVACGDRVRLCCPEAGLPAQTAEISVPVLYEDGAVAVFDKPPDMPVHPSLKHHGDTLGNCFAAMYPGLTFRPVNRLDKDTSGCVLTAKSQFAAAALQGRFEKEYLALCCGHPKGGIINAPIAREEHSLIKRCVREDGKAAQTRFEVIAETEKYSLCRVMPVTGRTHQIRVHFAYIGCPLAGDELYGGSLEDMSRQALHCTRLSFISPEAGAVTVCSSEPGFVSLAGRLTSETHF